jgi:hypothetical protein
MNKKHSEKKLRLCYSQRFQQGDPFLRRIVAIDETWIRDFEPELKSQSAQWKHPSSPRPSKCRRQQSKVKQMAFDHEGVPVGVSVTAGYYATFCVRNCARKFERTGHSYWNLVR